MQEAPAPATTKLRTLWVIQSGRDAGTLCHTLRQRGRRIRGLWACASCRDYALGVAVDVQTEIEIERVRRDVAAYASDPDNATAWYENIKSVEWKSPKPVAVGSRIAFVAQFLGRRLAYTYEVKELIPGERFVMSTAEGAFPMETTYAWRDTEHGGTKMVLQNRGAPVGVARFAAPLVAGAMRRANRKDLIRLKTILEGPDRL